jgi:hypothetical protein
MLHLVGTVFITLYSVGSDGSILLSRRASSLVQVLLATSFKSRIIQSTAVVFLLNFMEASLSYTSNCHATMLSCLYYCHKTNWSPKALQAHLIANSHSHSPQLLTHIPPAPSLVHRSTSSTPTQMRCSVCATHHLLILNIFHFLTTFLTSR